MAHSFGKVLLSTQMACGFATAIDGRVDKIVDNLGVVKPTFMGAAPRIFEKAHGRIVTMTAAEGGAKEKIFTQAFKVGLEVDRLKREGKSVPLPLKVQHGLFDKLVFSKVRDRFGGRVRFFISGAAALNRDIAEWFHAAGILILEGYGLTETSAGSFVNHPDDYRFGTVGPAVPGTEVKLGDGDEILIKGPGVMDGYHNLPEETAKTLTDDGWLRTGDKGSVDADGYLTITGRIKELFKTSGGKYVAPPAIESKFKAICPYASQFMVFGNERNFCVALVTLDPDAIAGWAAENGVTGDYAAIVRLRQVPRDGAGLRRRAQQQPQPVGDHQEVGAARPRPHRRVGRADPVDEGQAQRGRGQLQGAPRRVLRLRSQPGLASPQGTHRRRGCAGAMTSPRPRDPRARPRPAARRRHPAPRGLGRRGCSASSAGWAPRARWPPARPTPAPRESGPPAGGPPDGGGMPGGPGPTSSVADGEIPEETAGPFPGDGSNGPNVLTESGHRPAGHHHQLRLGDRRGRGRAADAAVPGLRPVGRRRDRRCPGAALYAWHCDREGSYSMYDGDAVDENYLRGVQEADEDGWLSFTTIFPGCYAGRWPHVHFEVYESVETATSASNKQRTSQLAFPQDVCEEVYATEGYEQSVTNLAGVSLDTDGIFSDGHSLQLARVTGSVEEGYVATLNVPI